MMQQRGRASEFIRAAGPVLLLVLLVVGVLMTFVGLIAGVTVLRSAAQRTTAEAPRDGAAADDRHEPAGAAPATVPTDAGTALASKDLDSAHAQASSVDSAKPVEAPSAAAAPVAPAPQVTSAALLRVDENTGGAWVGRYGTRGYSLAMATETPHLPAGVKVTMEGSQFYLWDLVTTDSRALSMGTAPSHLSAGQWFWWDHFSVDLDLRDSGKSHQVALYLLDWDTDARGQRLDVLDASSGAVLFSRSDEHFRKGRYVILRLSGHVVLRFTKSGGANCTLSGVFFDDPPAGG